MATDPLVRLPLADRQERGIEAIRDALTAVLEMNAAERDEHHISKLEIHDWLVEASIEYFMGHAVLCLSCHGEGHHNERVRIDDTVARICRFPGCANGYLFDPAHPYATTAQENGHEDDVDRDDKNEYMAEWPPIPPGERE